MAEKDSCPCPETSCSRHEKCEQCQAYHHKRRERTICGK